MIGDLHEAKVSAYQPPVAVVNFTATVQKDFQYADALLNRPWVELNNRSVIEDMNRGQRTFNAYVDETVENEAEAWKWRGTRSKARNRALVMHAHLTAGYIFPSFYAQNPDDEEDRGFSEAMTDAVEWLGINSNYRQSFLLAAMGMLVNPVTYMGIEWYEVMQKVKQRMADGSVETREQLDEVLSGFQAPMYSADQVLINNMHEQNIQRQKCIFKRRYIEYGEARAKYGDHEHWNNVQPGQKSVFNGSEGLFYDIKDDAHPGLVEEITPLYRRDDTEVCFLGGIYMGEPDVEQNPIRHRDNRGAPKYNVVPFGYHRINEHFFPYKSLMNSMWWDNQLADAQYEIGMNTAFLAANMPTAIMGPDKIDSEIMFPSAVVQLSKDTTTRPLLPSINPSALWEAFSRTEDSMDEASVSETVAGQLPPGNTKATAISIARRQSETILKAVGKPLAESMAQVGDLMKDVVANHLSVAEVSELLGDNFSLKYRTLVLKEKMTGGKLRDKILRFDEGLIGRAMSEEEKTLGNVALYEEAEQKGGKQTLRIVNPQLFARTKYLTRIEPEEMFPKNKEYMQAVISQKLAQHASNPYASLEALTREDFYSLFGSRGEDFMKKPDELELQSILGAGAGGLPKTVMGQQAENGATGSMLSAASV